MTRGELKSLMGSLGKRTDATDALLNSFIELAEAEVAKLVRPSEWETTVTLGESDRDALGVYDLPADFLAPREVYRVGTRDGPLTQKALAELRTFASTSGPWAYALYGFKIEFRGTPAEDTEFDLIYFARPDAMTSDSDEPALLASQPGVYVHAAMHWYRIWAEDVELATAHGQALADEAEQINALASRRRGGAKLGRSGNYGNFSPGGSM